MQSGGPNRERYISGCRGDIASYFFPRNRVHFYLTPVRLAQAAAPAHYTAPAKCRPTFILFDIASYFFPKNRVHFYLTPVRLTQAAAPRIVPRPQNAGRTMPPHISHRPVQNCINIRDATLHFISLYQVFKLTTSCSWFLLFSNALLKSKGRRMATSLSRRGLKIPRIYILDLTFTNMYRITREKKACG